MGASPIQTIMASNRRSTWGRFFGWTIMSPRLTSTSSSSRSETDMGG